MSAPRADVRERLGAEAVDRVIDGRSMGLIPGLIDTHVHLSETLSRAVFPDVLGTRAWVFHWAKPFYAHVDEADESVSVQVGMTEMLRSGTTCFLDMGAQNDPGVTALAAADIGIRGVVGRHAADRPARAGPRGLVGGDDGAPLLPGPPDGAVGSRGRRASLERDGRRPGPLLGEHRGQGAVQPRTAPGVAGAGGAAGRRHDVPHRHQPGGVTRQRAQVRRLAGHPHRAARRPGQQSRPRPCRRAHRRGGRPHRCGRDESGVLPLARR